MENLLLGKFLDLIIKIIHKSISRSENMPLIKTEILFHPDEYSNPQLYYLHITNRSEKDYIVNRSVLMKRNKKYKNPIIFTDADLFIPDKVLLKNELNHDNIAKQFQSMKQIDNICIKAKDATQLIIHYKMSDEFYKYWSNFEFNIVPGFIAEDGRIFPSWRAPKFEWEVLIGDEMNLYWTRDQELFPYQLYLEKNRHIILMKVKLDRGETISFYSLFAYKFNIVNKQLKYIFFLILIKLNIANRIPEHI